MWALCITGWCSAAGAQETLLQRNYDNEGKTRIEVSAVLGAGMTRGYLPVRVTVRNASAINRTWNLSFSYSGGYREMGYHSDFSVSAAPGAEEIHELLVPVPTLMNPGSSYRQLQVNARTAGLPGEQNFTSTNLDSAWPSLAISRKLAERNLNALNSGASSSGSGRDRFASQFDPAQLPADWRAYSGLDGLLITEEEWDAASPGARLAILEWTRLGGKLDVYTRETNAATILPRLLEGGAKVDGNVAKRGLGMVRAWTWNGQDLTPHPTVQRYRAAPNLAKDLGEDFQGSWQLLKLFGTKSFNPLLVVLLLIAFGVVVGPVNLFVLAKPGQRQRLFITTPIISLVASLLILMLILLGDGIGGSGRRAVLANLEPAAAEKRLYIVQEQISRTGVLLGSAFQIDEPVFLSPVRIPPSEWNRLEKSGGGESARYSLAGAVFSGDWYQSRSEQGHFLQAVRPTRSRIELQSAASPDGKQPPRLFSSLEFTLDELFYRDDLGKVWKATGGGTITGGQRIDLTPVESVELERWWKDKTGVLSEATRNRAANLWSAPGRFFAISSDKRAGFIDTLDAIRWRDDTAIIHGAVLPVSGNAELAPAPAPGSSN